MKRGTSRPLARRIVGGRSVPRVEGVMAGECVPCLSDEAQARGHRDVLDLDDGSTCVGEILRTACARLGRGPACRGCRRPRRRQRRAGTPGEGALYPELSPGRGGLAKTSFALIDHLRSVDKRRVRRVFGRISSDG